MGLGIAQVTGLLELYNLGYLKGKSNVLDIGSQELHLRKNDLKNLCNQTKMDISEIDKYPDIDMYPAKPRCSSKHLWKSLGIENYSSIDINEEHGSLKHDLNLPFEKKDYFNKFDIVTDVGSCEHVFNIPEAYKTVHKITKPGGLIIIYQAKIGGNGYYQFDRFFFEGLAAANNYKIVISNYTIILNEKTKEGSYKQFRIPFSQDFLNIINKESVKNVGLEIIFQKNEDSEFKIPYQGSLMKIEYNNFGYNKVFHRDDLSYSFIPQHKISDVTLKQLIKEFISRLKEKMGRKFRRLK